MNIKYDNDITEFEIQAQLYVLLKNLGFNVKGEYTIHSRDIPKVKAILDIVVFNKDNKPTHIIECKSPVVAYNSMSKIRQQLEWYEMLFHLPVILCYNVNQFTDIINTLSK